MILVRNKCILWLALLCRLDVWVVRDSPGRLQWRAPGTCIANTLITYEIQIQRQKRHKHKENKDTNSKAANISRPPCLPCPPCLILRLPVDDLGLIDILCHGNVSVGQPFSVDQLTLTVSTN